MYWVTKEVSYQIVQKYMYVMSLNCYTVVTKFVLYWFQKSGLYEYKVYGVLDDVRPDICAQVYMDIEYRKQWDSYVKGEYTQTSLWNCFVWLQDVVFFSQQRFCFGCQH